MLFLSSLYLPVPLLLFSLFCLPCLTNSSLMTFRNESFLGQSTTNYVGNSKNHRAKRQYGGGGSSAGGSSCGCLSKFTPVNCKCATTATDDLLCRCDRAILATVRDDPERGSASFCPCRRSSGGGDSNTNFRGELAELTSKVQSLANGGGSNGIHSACHPICHQSCLNTCTRPRERGGDFDLPPYRSDRYGNSPVVARDQQHQQPMESPYEPLPGCQPSLCRSNCLRACSRILDGQPTERGGTNAPFQENLEPPPHYEVRPVDPWATKTAPPDYGQRGESAGGPSSCQCSPVGFCDCPETCFPMCFDSCEANCHQQQPQTQRRLCAQNCHFECQRNCAEKQRQKQLLIGGGGVTNELSTQSAGNNNWPIGQPLNGEVNPPSPPMSITGPNSNNNEMNAVGTGFQAGNAIIGGGGGGGSNCMSKCPKSCEAACTTIQQQQNEDAINCVPACVAVCAQSCSQTGASAADPSHNQNRPPQSLLTRQQLFQQQQQLQQQQLQGGNPQQQNMELLNQQLMEGLVQQQPMQILDLNALSQQLQQQNGSTNGEGQQQQQQRTAGQTAGGKEMRQSASGSSQLPPTMFINDGGPFRTSRQQPCAPLCQPECRAECNRRYMEERRPEMRPYRGIGQLRHKGQQLISGGGGLDGGRMEQSTTDNNMGQGQYGQQSLSDSNRGFGQPKSSPPKNPQNSLFPPHYILPMDDDLDLLDGGNGTTIFGQTTMAMDEPEMVKAMDDGVELFLRPQNETGGNSTQVEAVKNGQPSEKKPTTPSSIAKPLAGAKPWKGGVKMGSGDIRKRLPSAEEFFKRRMKGKLGTASKFGSGKNGGNRTTTAMATSKSSDVSDTAMKPPASPALFGAGDSSGAKALPPPKWFFSLVR